MKQFKRVMAMLLTLVMTLGLFAGLTLPASAATYTGTFVKCTDETLTSGYYVIGVMDGSNVLAINNTAGTSWIKYTSTSVSSNKVTNPDNSVVWYYDASAGTIKNVANNNYIYWTSGNVGCCGSTSYAHAITRTDATGIYKVTSEATPARILRRNGTSGYRYYTTSTGSQDIYFYKQAYQVTTATTGTGAGTVTMKDASNNTISSGDYVFAGTVITLTATASSGSFTSWADNASGTFDSTTSASTTYTMPAANSTITATFTAAGVTTYDVTYALDGGTPSSYAAGSVAEGSGYTIPAANTPTKANYRFDGWKCSLNNTVYQAGATIPSDVIDDDFTLTAQWTRVYTIMVDDPATGGTVTATYGGNDYTDDQSFQAAAGETVTLTASPATHYVFDSWDVLYGTVVGNTYTVPASDDIISCSFVDAPKATITLSENGNTSTVNTEYQGDSYTLPGATNNGANTPTGYALVGWSTVAVPAQNNAPTSNYYPVGSTFPSLPASQTFYAVYAVASGNGTAKYVHITAEPTGGYAGTYVFVGKKSETYYALNGSLAEGTSTNQMGNASSPYDLTTAELMADSNESVLSTIAANYVLTIEAATYGNTSGYSIKTSDNKYLGWTSSTTITKSDSVGSVNQLWDIDATTTPATIKNKATNGYYILFNNSNTTTWRTYSSLNYSMMLYKYNPGITYSGYTTSVSGITYNVTVNEPSPAAGGTIECTNGNLTGNVATNQVTLTATPAEGYSFDEWTISGAASVDTSTPGVAVITFGSANVTATCSFTLNSHAVTFDDETFVVYVGETEKSTGDAISYGTTVKITAAPDGTHYFSSWDVYKTSDSTVKVTVTGSTGTEDTFVMPDYPVTVNAVILTKPTATFAVNGTANAIAAMQVVPGNITLPTPSVLAIKSGGNTFEFIGWAVTAEVSSETATVPGTIYPASSTYNLTADTAFRAVYARTTATSNSTFIVSYTSGGTTYYAGAKGSGSFLDAFRTPYNAATFGLEDATSDDHSGYYYLYYLSGADKIYLSNNDGSALTFSAANTKPTANYFLWKQTDDGLVSYKYENDVYTAGRRLEWNSDRFSSYSYSPARPVTKANSSTYGFITVGTAVVSHLILADTDPTGYGTVTTSVGGATSEYAVEGQIVSLTLSDVPEGWQLGSWTVKDSNDQDVTVTNANSPTLATFAMPDDGVTVLANIVKKNYTITTTVDPADSGTISVKVNGADYAGAAQLGDTITFTAAPESGYALSGVTVTKAGGAGTITPSLSEGVYSFTMEAKSVTIAATYVTTYNVTFIVKDQTVAALAMSGYEGQTLTLPNAAAVVTAVGSGADEIEYDSATYTFAGWAVTGKVNSPANSISGGVLTELTMGDSDVTLRAVYRHGSGSSGGTATLYNTSGDLPDGDYVIVSYYGSKYIAMKAEMNGTSNLTKTDITDDVSSDTTITDPDELLIWHVAKSGDYYTIYNAAYNSNAGGYIAAQGDGTTYDNKGTLVTTVTDYARFTISDQDSTYPVRDLTNKGKTTGKTGWYYGGTYWGMYTQNSSVYQRPRFFRYTATEASQYLTDEATFTVVMNDDVVLLTGESKVTINVLANDTIPDGTASTLALDDAYTGFDVDNGQITFDPTAISGGFKTEHVATYYIEYQGAQHSADVIVKPAEQIYYEDYNTNGIFSFTDGTRGVWEPVNTTGAGSAADLSANAQALSLINEVWHSADSTDPTSLMYSGNQAHKTTVYKVDQTGGSYDAATERWPFVEFTFAGTGFEVASVTSNTTGGLQYYVYSGSTVSGTPIKRGAVNTYMGFTYDNGTWTASGTGTYYQIPVIKVDDLSYGTYTVRVYALYSPGYDPSYDSTNPDDQYDYDLYFDGARIFNPLNETAVYSYHSFRDAVATAHSLGVVPVAGAVTANFYVNGVLTSSQTVAEGSSITLPAAPTMTGFDGNSYTFYGWKVGSAIANGETTTAPDAADIKDAGASYTLSANTDFYAVATYGEASGGAGSSITSWAAGTYYMVTKYGDNYYAMSGAVSSNTVAAVDITSAVTNTSGVLTIDDSDSSMSGKANMAYTISGSASATTIKQGNSTIGNSGAANLNTTATDWYCNYSSNQFTIGDAATPTRQLMYKSGTGFKNYASSNAGGSGYGDGKLWLVPTSTGTTTTYATTFYTVTPLSIVLSGDVTNDGVYTIAQGGTLNASATLNVELRKSTALNWTASPSGKVTWGGTTENRVITFNQTGTITITVTCAGDNTIRASFTVNVVEASATYDYTLNVYENGTKNETNSSELTGQTTSTHEYTLPSSVSSSPAGYTFKGWVVQQYSGNNAYTGTDAALLAATSFIDPGDTLSVTGVADGESVTNIYALYTKEATESASAGYNKITAVGDLTTGDYLIVCETANRAFDGSRGAANNLLDANNNYIGVTIDGTTIASNSTIDASSFHYDATATTLQSASGYYIGATAASNSLNNSTETTYTNTITFDSSGNALIQGSGGYYLQYNTSASRFRYYSSGNAEAVALYKKTAGGESTTAYYYTTGASVSSGYAASVSAGNTSGSATMTAPNGTTCLLGTSTGYTQASDVVYQTSGDYVKNWGSRGETATFLTSYATAYYTGSYTYETLSSYSGGTSQATGNSNALFTALKSMLTTKQTSQTSYSGTNDLYKYTDCVNNNSSYISSFYTGTRISGTWDSGSTWNKEHTWPNSKCNSPMENDIMMLRPTSTAENSGRSNNAYGEASGYYNPYGNYGTWTVYSGQALNDVRGDVARIVLYCYVRWDGYYIDTAWGSSGNMQNLDILLSWMAADPVDTWEMGRNDAVQSITGVRNVFVDYPELAWQLFGQTCPNGYPTPSNPSGTRSVNHSAAVTPASATRVSDNTQPNDESRETANTNAIDTRSASTRILYVDFGDHFMWDCTKFACYYWKEGVANSDGWVAGVLLPNTWAYYTNADNRSNIYAFEIPTSADRIILTRGRNAYVTGFSGTSGFENQTENITLQNNNFLALSGESWNSTTYNPTTSWSDREFISGSFTFPDDRVLYFDISGLDNGGWPSSDANLYAYARLGDGSTEWYKLTAVAGSTGIYQTAAIDAGTVWTGLRLVRFAPEVDEGDEVYNAHGADDTFWGQTRNIALPAADKNLATVTGGTYDTEVITNAAAAWGVYKGASVDGNLITNGAVLIDGMGVVENYDDYLNYGPKNELYLAQGNAIIVYINGTATDVAIGAKALDGNATGLSVYTINADDSLTSVLTGATEGVVSVTSASERFYPIAVASLYDSTHTNRTKVLLIYNPNSHPVSLTSMRIDSASGATLAVTGEATTRGINALRRLRAGTATVVDTNGSELPIVSIPTYAKIEGGSISLEGQIDVNFYVNVPASLINSGVYATLEGERVSFIPTTTANVYKVVLPLPAKEMSREVTFRLYKSDGTQIQFKDQNGDYVYETQFSVMDYLNYTIQTKQNETKLYNLCLAMKAYGTYAQTFFEYGTAGTVDPDTAAAINAVSIGADEYLYTYTPDTANIRYYGESVVTESETTIRFYFRLSGELSDYTVTVNGAAGGFVQAGSYYYVEVANIAAKDLGKANTVTVTYGEETLTIAGYSVYTYLRKQLNGGTNNEDLIRLCKSMKYYGDLAKAYFPEEGN